MQTAKFAIKSPELPGAIFASYEAMLENVTNAKRYEEAVAEYAKTRDAFLLQVDLTDIGYTAEDVAWHIARPGERMRQEYA
ncbi:MAG TPA: hypothetical protein VNR39_12140 [Pseudolabrys sp.]|nr:hypothetical protein [Pseudolabrys sp.]